MEGSPLPCSHLVSAQRPRHYIERRGAGYKSGIAAFVFACAHRPALGRAVSLLVVGLVAAWAGLGLGSPPALDAAAGLRAGTLSAAAPAVPSRGQSPPGSPVLALCSPAVVWAAAPSGCGVPCSLGSPCALVLPALRRPFGPSPCGVARPPGPGSPLAPGPAGPGCGLRLASLGPCRQGAAEAALRGRLSKQPPRPWRGLVWGFAACGRRAATCSPAAMPPARHVAHCCSRQRHSCRVSRNLKREQVPTSYTALVKSASIWVVSNLLNKSITVRVHTKPSTPLPTLEIRASTTLTHTNYVDYVTK